MPEVHIVGEINGAELFGGGGGALPVLVDPVASFLGMPFSRPAHSVRWHVSCEEEHWQLLDGATGGRTHESTGASALVFNHPMEVHYHCSTLRSPPKMTFEVLETHGDGSELSGVGFCHVPVTAGTHAVEVALWRPYASAGARLRAAFLGGYPQLKGGMNAAALCSSREKLATETIGSLHITLNIVSGGAFSFGDCGAKV